MAQTENTLIAQARLLRVLALLQLLLSGRRFTIEELASILDSSPRSAYRYLHLLEAVDLPIEKDFHNRYFLAQDNCPLCSKNHTLIRIVTESGYHDVHFEEVKIHEEVHHG
jgi:hypothetical protein